jgi:hypothetical protein
MKISSFSERNEWQLLKPLGKPPSRRRRQTCVVVGDKVFLFGGTSPLPLPNPHGMQDYDIDDNHQGQDAKLMDHSDLHVLDFGMFHSFIMFHLFVLYACECSPFAPNFHAICQFL